MNRAISLWDLLEGERNAVQNYNSASETIELLKNHGRNAWGLIADYQQTQKRAATAIEYYRQKIKNYIKGLENF